jgi:hypothetical protein
LKILRTAAAIMFVLAAGCHTGPPEIPPASIEIGAQPGCAKTPGIFAQTHPMITPRSYQTATMLADGTVLIAGGRGGDPALGTSTTEIYDPQISGFRAGPSMSTSRVQAVAVRLLDGRVLIAGGLEKSPLEVSPAQQKKVKGNAVLSSAEIYDPASGKFSDTGDMTLSRAGHSATLLDDGSVLIAGGFSKSVEVFETINNGFAPAGSLNRIRFGNTSVKLRDGRVLIACGDVETGAKGSSAEIYDPKTQHSTLTDTMLAPMFFCTGLLLNNGDALVVGFPEDDKKEHEAELFDPKTGKFSSAGDIHFGLTDPIPTLMNDGRVFISSAALPAYANASDALTAAIFDPASSKFTEVGAVNPARTGYTSTTLNDGSILIAGGESPFPPKFPDRAMLYCP